MIDVAGLAVRVLYNDDVNVVRLVGEGLVIKGSKNASGSWVLQAVKLVPPGVATVTPGWQTSIEAEADALPAGLELRDLEYIGGEAIKLLEIAAGDIGVRL